MMMFETSKHVLKTEKCCCVFKNIYQQNSDHILTAKFEVIVHPPRLVVKIHY